MVQNFPKISYTRHSNQIRVKMWKVSNWTNPLTHKFSVFLRNSLRYFKVFRSTEFGTLDELMASLVWNFRRCERLCGENSI